MDIFQLIAGMFISYALILHFPLPTKILILGLYPIWLKILLLITAIIAYLIGYYTF